MEISALTVFLADFHWYVGDRVARKSTDSNGTREIHEFTTGPCSTSNTETLLSSESRDATTHPAVPPVSQVHY